MKYPYIVRMDDGVELASTSPYYNSAYDSAKAGVTTTHRPYYQFQLDTHMSFSDEIPLTTMPIPTIEFPLILNLGGANLRLTVDWKTITVDDVAALMQFFSSANPSATFAINLTAQWGSGISGANNSISNRYTFSTTSTTDMVINGVISSLSIKEEPGQIMWSCSIAMMIGEEVT
jgi:hypothetical protein